MRSREPRRRHPTSTRPVNVYLMALEMRFCSSRRSRRRSDRMRSEVGLKPEKKLVDSEAHDLGLHRAGVEPGDFEQRRKDVFDGLKRCVDIGDERRFAESLACSTYRGGKGEALHEARHVEPGGVQRLKNVMARGGEEFRLRQVGGFSGRLCLGEFRIEMLKLD